MFFATFAIDVDMRKKMHNFSSVLVSRTKYHGCWIELLATDDGKFKPRIELAGGAGVVHLQPEQYPYMAIVKAKNWISKEMQCSAS